MNLHIFLIKLQINHLLKKIITCTFVLLIKCFYQNISIRKHCHLWNITLTYDLLLIVEVDDLPIMVVVEEEAIEADQGPL